MTFPILVGVCSGGGALTGGIAGYWSSKGIKAILEGNKEAYGFCIEKEEGKFTDFIKNIGKSLNTAFGGKAKSGLDDTTMGYIVLGIVAFFIIIAFRGR